MRLSQLTDSPVVKELGRVHPVEAVFVVVTFGFMLEEFAASKEHGWTGELPRVLIFEDLVRLTWIVYSANVSCA